MAEHLHERQASSDRPRGGNRASRWVFWGFALIAAYFLWTEHRAHVVQFLPLALLLACPLLHLFHGHGGHGAHRHEARQREPERERIS